MEHPEENIPDEEELMTEKEDKGPLESQSHGDQAKEAARKDEAAKSGNLEGVYNPPKKK